MILNIAQSKEFAQNELEALTCIAEPSIVLLMEAFIKVTSKFLYSKCISHQLGLSQRLLLLLLLTFLFPLLSFFER